MAKTKEGEEGKYAARVAVWAPGKIAVTQTIKGDDDEYHIDKDRNGKARRRLVEPGDNTNLAIAIWKALNGRLEKF